MAYHWLVEDDFILYEPLVPQRYILSVLYFATGGDNWVQCSANASQSTCETGTRFLQNTTECAWMGLECGGDGTVTTIDISDNGLNGILPDEELSRLEDLTTLSLEKNGKLRVPALSFAGRLSKLETLDLSEVRIEGTIPEGIYDLVSLKTLQLQQSKLHGTISSRLFSLDSLVFARFDNNKLAGTLPEEGWEKMGDLEVLALNGNDIVGQMPASACSLAYERGGRLRTLWADCGDSSFSCELDCCTLCFRSSASTRPPEVPPSLVPPSFDIEWSYDSATDSHLAQSTPGGYIISHSTAPTNAALPGAFPSDNIVPLPSPGLVPKKPPFRPVRRPCPNYRGRQTYLLKPGTYQLNTVTQIGCCSAQIYTVRIFRSSDSSREDLLPTSVRANNDVDVSGDSKRFTVYQGDMVSFGNNINHCDIKSLKYSLKIVPDVPVFDLDWSYNRATNSHLAQSLPGGYILSHSTAPSSAALPGLLPCDNVVPLPSPGLVPKKPAFRPDRRRCPVHYRGRETYLLKPGTYQLNAVTQNGCCDTQTYALSIFRSPDSEREDLLVTSVKPNTILDLGCHPKRFTVYQDDAITFGNNINQKSITTLTYSVRADMFSSKTWVQRGRSLEGETLTDQAGFSSAISDDGVRVAIGAPRNSRIGSPNTGSVRVFDYSPNGFFFNWTQVAEIDGISAGEQFGKSVSLSGNGKRIAIGAVGNDDSGKVRLYEDISGSWTLVGELDGENQGDLFGLSVSLSFDGFTVAVGAPYHSANADTLKTGRVYVYKQEGDAVWSQVSDPLSGTSTEDLFGWSISLSLNGSHVAVGAPKHEDRISDSGYVNVYQYPDLGGTWEMVGESLTMGFPGDGFGRAVSLSADGSRLSVGSPRYIKNGEPSAFVCVYEKVDSWSRLGDILYGGERFGFSVSLSSDGNRLAVGSPRKLSSRSTATGQVAIYELFDRNWEGRSLTVEEDPRNVGFSVALSSDGTIIALGIPSVSQVRVFTIRSDMSLTTSTRDETNYESAYRDLGTGSKVDLSVWRPHLKAGEFRVTYTAMPGYDKPSFSSVVVSGGIGALKPPKHLVVKWTDQGTGGDRDGQFYEAVPEDGYKCLSDLAVHRSNSGLHPEKVVPPHVIDPDFRCVHESLVVCTKLGNLIWTDAGSGARYDGATWQIDSSPGMRVSRGGGDRPPHSQYKLKALSKNHSRI